MTADGTSIGLIGLGLMGRNLGARLHEAGFLCTVYSYDEHERDGFEHSELVASDLSTFIRSLGQPRTILVMVTAGEPVDGVVGDLLPLLSPGDVIIDGGNSFFGDTQRRSRRLAEAGIGYLGAGISGGAEGARHGASIMVGGDVDVFARHRELFAALAARVDEKPCLVHVGPDGAGHFIKMVHNGIEYGLMQAIAEIWSFMDRVLGMPRERQRDVFRAWRGGPAASFLVDITADILDQADDAGEGWLLDAISDRAGQKGTGRWAVEAALELGVAIPTIDAAVVQRLVSMRGDRGGMDHTREQIRDDGDWPLELEQALHGAMLATFLQGFELLAAASDHYGWPADLGAVATTWRGGCIVRAKLLEDFDSLSPERGNVIPDKLANSADAMRGVVGAAVEQALPVPALSASLPG
ncbi:MAG: NADP-dependent phosphogluconate dehydrogenase [Gammaproteobacteria bacterium]|nr:NADP-dependent phosphogluconate dehydrogenase [Gammaproteobacteria bacterium]